MELQRLKHLLALGQVQQLKELVALQEQTLVGGFLLRGLNSQAVHIFQVVVH